MTFEEFIAAIDDDLVKNGFTKSVASNKTTGKKTYSYKKNTRNKDWLLTVSEEVKVKDRQVSWYCREYPAKEGWFEDFYPVSQETVKAIKGHLKWT